MELEGLFNELGKVYERGTRLLYFKEGDNGSIEDVQTAGKWSFLDRLFLSYKGYTRYSGKPGTVAEKVNAAVVEGILDHSRNQSFAGIPTDYRQILEQLQKRLAKGETGKRGVRADNLEDSIEKLGRLILNPKVVGCQWQNKLSPKEEAQERAKAKRQWDERHSAITEKPDIFG